MTATCAPVLELVDVGRIVASPDQNRTEFDPAELRELAESIRELGLLQPIKVRPAGCVMGADIIEPRYTLVAGERRLRAARDLLGWSTVPAIVAGETDDTAALATLAENMVRVDPGPLEEARGLARVAALYGLTAHEVAARVGKSHRWVRDRLALLELADDVAHWVQVGSLPIGRAVLMAGLDMNRQRLALAAHERGVGADVFRALVGRLEGEQAAESMFDAGSFLRVEEYVMDAENVVAAEPVKMAREPAMGVAEIAEWLEVKPVTVRKWQERASAHFPPPDMRVGGSPAWWQSTVKKWAITHGRYEDDGSLDRTELYRWDPVRRQMVKREVD